jgi:hypothetical protein
MCVNIGSYYSATSIPARSRVQRAVEKFANHYGKSPDKLGLNELRSYQAYLRTSAVR